MKKQRTFSHNNPDRRAVEWLLDLAKVFRIKSAKIKYWEKEYENFARVEVNYE